VTQRLGCVTAVCQTATGGMPFLQSCQLRQSCMTPGGGLPESAQTTTEKASTQ